MNTTTGLSPQAASLNFNARYVYDEQGRLLGEYSPEGKLISETIWFDDLPVATIRPKNASNQLLLGTAGTGAATANNTGANTAANPVNVEVYYVHPDHLGTPRVVTRSAAVGGATSGPNAVSKAVWRWDSDPFGTSLDNSKPNENPQQVTGTQTQIQAASFKVNNRFPGQLFDAETSKSYNYFRDYDPSVGRYVESDPIGLKAGLNTFGYVSGRPLTATDSLGLDVRVCFYAGGVGHVGFGNGNGDDQSTWGFYPKKPGSPFGPGAVKSDDGHPKNECMVLPADKKKDDCMDQCRKDRLNSPGNYDVVSRQCTSFVRDCLKQCGLPYGTFGPGPEPYYRSLPGAEPYPIKIN